jgi:hypothetical protein
MICGIDAAGRPGGDAGERGDAALAGFLGAHQHDGGGAVIDAGRVAGRHRAFLVEGGAQLLHASMVAPARMYSSCSTTCRPCGP